MHFKQFLTEVSSGDIVAFNKAVDAGEFQESYQIRAFFTSRGYKEIGYGLFAEVFQSKEYFVVKVAVGDSAFNSYVKMLRGGGRMNPHFPKIIAQKKVTERINVFFIERLMPFSEVSVKDLVAHHRKEDAGIFVWLIPGFINAEEGPIVVETAKQLDINFRPNDPPIRPTGEVPADEFSQYYADLNKYRTQFRPMAEKMLPKNHRFLQAVRQISNVEGNLDLHGGNIMIRKPSFEVVLTDPVS
jgi:hypothetical protein